MPLVIGSLPRGVEPLVLPARAQMAMPMYSANEAPTTR